MTAHVFLRYVPPEFEDDVRELGFRKFRAENGGASIWLLDNVAVCNGPLDHMTTEQVGSHLRGIGIAGQIFEARIWGLALEP